MDGALISTLSHGYRQRVGVAQALVHRPAFLILDEPTSGLDPAQIRGMRELIRGLKGAHTVLVSSHILPEISETCDRLLIVHNGQLVAQGTEEELARKLGGGSIEVEVRGDKARALAGALGTGAGDGGVRGRRGGGARWRPRRSSGLAWRRRWWARGWSCCGWIEARSGWSPSSCG